MSETKRDPRQDPKVGDVLQTSEGVRREVRFIELPNRENPDITYFSPPRNRKMYIFRSNWRKWAKDAKVIRAAD